MHQINLCAGSPNRPLQRHELVAPIASFQNPSIHLTIRKGCSTSALCGRVRAREEPGQDSNQSGYIGGRGRRRRRVAHRVHNARLRIHPPPRGPSSRGNIGCPFPAGASLGRASPARSSPAQGPPRIHARKGASALTTSSSATATSGLSQRNRYYGCDGPGLSTSTETAWRLPSRP